ncbi:MAG TPA: hypothetical protein VJN96_13995 [Vicinamibacterales bacterium]|nr:hypothetical protein [Vicinamibacterales bacterium]
MKRVFNCIVIIGLAAQTLVIGQGQDASKVLSLVREALGGDKKIAAVKTLTVSGRSAKVSGETTAPAADFEIAMELPDKYMKKEVVATIGTSTIARTTGFNGEGLIDATDTPPMGGGMMVMRFGGPGGGAAGAQPTPEQAAAMRKNALQAAHEDFTRLTLGMFASSFAAFPVEFSYAGQAESPDGKADVIGIKGADNFQARLFVDSVSHMPLMISWMAKEPMVMNMTSGPGRASSSGGANVVQFGAGGGGQQMTPEQRDQMMKEMQDRMKEAEAKRRTVEYRLYYGDYQDVSGVKLPFKLQRSIDGKPSEEMTLEKVKINQKIDPKKFEVAK